MFIINIEQRQRISPLLHDIAMKLYISTNTTSIKKISDHRNILKWKKEDVSRK